MTKLIIDGGFPLSGEVELPGSAMAGCALVATSLLTDDLLIVNNLPKVKETLGIVEIIEFLGLLPVFDYPKETFTVTPEIVKVRALPYEIAKKSHFFPLVLGGLLGRFHEAIIPDPVTLGFHPIDRILLALKSLGISIEKRENHLFLKGTLKGGTYRFKKNTVLGTLTLILVSCLSRVVVQLDNAAEEPEVDLLITSLNSMGAHIQRSKPRSISIRGVNQLRGLALSNMSDRDLAVFYGVLGVLSHGEISVRGVESSHLGAFLAKLTAAGGSFQNTNEALKFWLPSTRGLFPLELETRPHPGFMTNWVPLFSLLLSQADGVSVIHETVSSQPFSYLEVLKSFGFEYQLLERVVKDKRFKDKLYNFDSSDDETLKQEVKIFGPTKVVPTKVEKEAQRLPDALAILAAALLASGQSVIPAEPLLSGSDDLFFDLKKLGAKISTQG